MKNYKEGTDREQLVLIQTNLEERIESNNAVRVIDKVVDKMKVNGMGFKYSEIKKTGRCSYNPADMLKLYLYCYFFGIRSSRRIERECTINIELIWLIKELKPDHKTIANFRRDNKEAIEKSFVFFISICSNLGLLGKEIIAVDGSKFKASNSEEKYDTITRVQKRIEKTREKMASYMKTLDENDKEENKNKLLNFNNEEVQKKLLKLAEEIEKLEKLKIEVEQEGSIATTDADCKLMKMNNGGFNPAYNVQAAVDEKYGLAVAVAVVNAGNDNEQLFNISKQAKENLDVDEIIVLVDGGYNSGKQFAKCEEENISVICNVPRNKKSAPDEKYSKDKFKYDKENDTYICPQNFVLSMVSKKDTVVKRYSNPSACKSCFVKSSCTKSKYRDIERRQFEDYSEIVDVRAKENKQLLKKRKEIIEHVFGDIKYNFGFSYFLTRRFGNVITETFIHFLIYNLKRVINILGVRKILQSI